MKERKKERKEERKEQQHRPHNPVSGPLWYYSPVLVNKASTAAIRPLQYR
jgi:hypothetical protein